MDRANRAGVVVYTLDARGLQTGGLTAEDDPQTPLMSMPGSTGHRRRPHRADGEERRAGPGARTPGLAGFARLPGAADRRVRGAQQQRPGRWHGPRHRRHARLLPRSASTRRSRPTTTGIRTTSTSTSSDPGSACGHDAVSSGRPRRNIPARTAPADPLVAATLSPFATGAIDVRLTTLFAHDKTAGSYVRSLFFIDPAGLTFVDGADGRHEADLSLLLLAIGDNGQPVNQARLKVPLRLDDDGLRAAAPARAALQRAAVDEGAGRLPDPRRRAGRSLEGARHQRAVRRGAEGRQGPRRAVGRRDDGRRGGRRRARQPRPPRPCGPTSSPTASSASRR